MDEELESYIASKGGDAGENQNQDNSNENQDSGDKTPEKDNKPPKKDDSSKGDKDSEDKGKSENFDPNDLDLNDYYGEKDSKDPDDSDDSDDLEGIDDKTAKAIKKMQKRIDGLTKDKAELKKQLEDQNKNDKKTPEKDEIDEKMDSLKKEYSDLQKEKKDLRKKLRRAINEGEDDLADEIEDKIDDVNAQIRDVEYDFKGLEGKKAKKETSQKMSENSQKMGDWFNRVAKKYSAELLDSKGQLNMKSPLFQTAQAMLRHNAKPAKFAKQLYQTINPVYDHERGLYDAVRDAYEYLYTSKKKNRKASFKENNAVQMHSIDNSSPVRQPTSKESKTIEEARIKVDNAKSFNKQDSEDYFLTLRASQI